MKCFFAGFVVAVATIPSATRAAPEYAFVDPGYGASLFTIYQINNRSDFSGYYNAALNAVFAGDNPSTYRYIPSNTAAVRGLTSSRTASVLDTTGPISVRFDVVTGVQTAFSTGEVRMTNEDDEGVFWNGTNFVLAKFDGTLIGTYDASMRLLPVPSSQFGRSIRQSVNRDGAVVAYKNGTSDTAHVFLGGQAFFIPWSNAPNTVGLTLSSSFINDNYQAAGSGSKTVNFQNQRYGWAYTGGSVQEIPRNGSIDVTGLDNAGNAFGADGFDNGVNFAATHAWRWNSVQGKVSLASLVDMPGDIYTRTLYTPTAVSSSGIIAARFAGTPSEGAAISGMALLYPLSMTGRINGRVQSKDYTGSWEGIPAVIYIYEGTKNVAWRRIYLRADGSFTLNEPTLGIRDYVIGCRHFLRQKISSVSVTAGGTTSLEFSLLGGDIDRDNVISLFDYLILSEYFDRSSSDGDWNTVGANGFRPSSADLDFDGVVSVFDYIVISENFDAAYE